MKEIRKKRIAISVLAFVVMLAAGTGYLLYFPFALSNKVEELQREGRDFSSTPIFRILWTPANHLHNSWDAYRDYNHAQLKHLPNYEGIVWLIK